MQTFFKDGYEFKEAKIICGNKRGGVRVMGELGDLMG